MRKLQIGLAPHNPMSMILPAQLRAARALVGWSREALAKASGVPAPTIRDFELEKTDPKQGTVQKWRRALEQAGVEFQEATETSGPGVRLRA
jgi:transcriptional regulator with XRE-family HTH domain